MRGARLIVPLPGGGGLCGMGIIIGLRPELWIHQQADDPKPFSDIYDPKAVLVCQLADGFVFFCVLAVKQNRERISAFKKPWHENLLIIAILTLRFFLFKWITLNLVQKWYEVFRVIQNIG